MKAARAAASLLLVLLYAASAHAASGDECDGLPKPSITVRRIEEPIALNLQFGYRALNQLGASIAVRGQQILGLTRGKAVARFSTSSPGYVDRSGQWECASPQITLSFGYSPMTVYVAREFPPGGCAYQEIHAHELRHVKAYQEHAASIEKEITETLARRFASGPPWRGPVGQTRERLQREIEERWLPYVQRELRRAEEAQARIDTPEEYARVAGSCNGEIKKRLL